MEKILINVRIFWNTFFARVPFIKRSKRVSQVFQHSSSADWALVLYRPMDCGIVKPILQRSVDL